MKFKIFALLITLFLSFNAHASGGGDTGPVYNMDLDVISVNLKQPSNKKHLIVNAQLMLKKPDPALEDEAKEKFDEEYTHTFKVLLDYMPVIKHELIFLFREQTAEALSTREGVKHLRQEAKNAIGQIIEENHGNPEMLQYIVFTKFVMQ